jgi:transmembrane sensor
MSAAGRASREAIEWLIRLRHGSAQDWEAFTLWLEADPANAAAYDEATLADEMVQILPVRERISPDHMRPAATPRFARRAVIGFAAAAALAASVGLVWISKEPTAYTVATVDGERRSVTLPDGSRVDLNGGTAIELDHGNSRFARLLRGEALFTVAHDPKSPFRVAAGDTLVQDMGTVFNVAHSDDEVSVAVAEGAVQVRHGGRRIDLAPGMSMTKSAERIVVSRQNQATIGGWRQGRLIYSAAPLSRIALDLTRSTGIAFRAGPGAAERRFTGIIVIDGDREQLLRRLSALLGVRVVRSGEQMIFIAGKGDPT